MRTLAVRAESWPIAGRFTISRGSEARGMSSGATLLMHDMACWHVLAHIHAVGRRDREVERALAEEERGWIWS
jgi:hypothetical protein